MSDLELIIKKNTMSGSGRFDAENAIPELQALIDSKIIAELERLVKDPDYYTDRNPGSVTYGETFYTVDVEEIKDRIKSLKAKETQL